jgi:hypothetical protein
MQVSKVTSALLLGGKVNVKKVTLKELADFIAAEKLDVVIGKDKAEALNAICDALEARGDVAPEADEGPEVPDTDEPVGELGEPAVSGSNYLKRRAGKIKAGRNELGQIPSDLKEQASKSSYIARRFKKMNPKG